MLGIYLEAEFLEQELLVILIDVPEVFLPGGCALLLSHQQWVEGGLALS